MNACPPIALFLFRRPDCTRELLGALRRTRPSVLFIVADGPRPGRSDDVADCAEVRRVAETEIDWPCTVHRTYAPENMGCARRVSSGLDWVFSQVEEAIVLEDDCVPGERFVPFCSELLEQFRNDEHVGVIAGSNFQSRDVTDGRGYYFSRYPHCWGWATWRRAWRHYDHTMAAWPEMKRTGALRSAFETRAEADYWERIFDRVYAGEIDSWAYRWTFACWRHGLLTALPAANLVTNIGFDAAATHTVRRFSAPLRSEAKQPWPLVHPHRVTRNVAADRYTFEHHFNPSRWLRLKRRLALDWPRA